MTILAAGTATMRRLFTSSVKGSTRASDDESPANDELVLARIARMYP